MFHSNILQKLFRSKEEMNENLGINRKSCKNHTKLNNRMGAAFNGNYMIDE